MTHWQEETMTFATFSDVYRGERVTLAEELERLGIPTIDLSKVNAHKQKMLHGSRIGVWNYLFFVPQLLLRILFMGFPVWRKLSLFAALVGAAWAISSGEHLSLTLLSMTAIGLMTPSLVWLATFLLLLAATCIFAWFGEEHAVAFNLAGSFWQKTNYIPTHGELGEGGGWTQEPTRVTDRARRASQIDGTEIKVERFQKDPFLLVVRGPFFWPEKAYIAAWNTGDPELEAI